MSKDPTAAERSRRYRQANPEKVREAKRRWYEANREAERERDRCRRETERETRSDRNRRYRDNQRATVFAHYGTACACCGSVGDLTIDHINGDGKGHRLELFGRLNVNGTARFYLWLIKNGFPGGYQVLCLSCNASKADGDRCRLNHREA